MMNSALTVNKHIYGILSSDERLCKMVDRKNMFPIVAEENAKFPLIVFSRDAVQVEYTKDGVADDLCQFTVNCYAKNYTQTVDALQRVRELLELRCDGYFRRVTITAMDEEWNDNVYHQSLTFTCIIN